MSTHPISPRWTDGSARKLLEGNAEKSRKKVRDVIRVSKKASGTPIAPIDHANGLQNDMVWHFKKEKYRLKKKVGMYQILILLRN